MWLTCQVHPGRLTWNLRIHLWKRKIIFQSIIFRFYLNLRGCITSYSIKMMFGHQKMVHWKIPVFLFKPFFWGGRRFRGRGRIPFEQFPPVFKHHLKTPWKTGETVARKRCRIWPSKNKKWYKISLANLCLNWKHQKKQHMKEKMDERISCSKIWDKKMEWMNQKMEWLLVCYQNFIPELSNQGKIPLLE